MSSPTTDGLVEVILFIMSVRLYFLRHGQTELSRDDAFCGSGLNPELTDEGLEMAREFATAYSKTKWEAIFTSALRRTISTGAPLAQAVGITPKAREEVNEIGYGSWEGLTREKVTEQYHDDYIRWLADPAWHAPTNGELAVAISRRGMKLIEEIKANCETGNVLIVSHKATIRIILCALMGIDVGRFRYRFVCPVGSLSMVEFSAEGPLLHFLADRSHLSEHLKSLPGT
jgi:broad specificity phosphatase PhoE